MTPTLLAPALAPPNEIPSEIIHLSGISWKTYETLLEELSDRRFRLTYNRGNLEIMSPSPEHELSKEVLGRFIETIAEELKVSIYPLGSTTFKQLKLSGAEPDKCFYIRNIAAVQGKRRLDMANDPAPDLILEIDITSSSQNRLQVYADLGVAEVWIYDGEYLIIQQLQNDTYIATKYSQFFANLAISDIAGWLQKSVTMDYLELVKSFRQWVKSQIG
jgi:Uma2 family endonuclease